MDDLCKDVYYPDSSVNSKCSNYKIIYEQVGNYFIEDINLYNSTIKTYNEQQTAAGTNLLLEEYNNFCKGLIEFNATAIKSESAIEIGTDTNTIIIVFNKHRKNGLPCEKIVI